MAKKLQLRGGTTSDHGSFTGAVREVTVDTDLKTLRVHDGSTAGGTRLAKHSELSSFITASSTDTLTNKTATDLVATTASGAAGLDVISTDAGTNGAEVEV